MKRADKATLLLTSKAVVLFAAAFFLSRAGADSNQSLFTLALVSEDGVLASVALPPSNETSAFIEGLKVSFAAGHERRLEAQGHAALAVPRSVADHFLRLQSMLDPNDAELAEQGIIHLSVELRVRSAVEDRLERRLLAEGFAEVHDLLSQSSASILPSSSCAPFSVLR